MERWLRHTVRMLSFFLFFLRFIVSLFSSFFCILLEQNCLHTLTLACATLWILFMHQCINNTNGIAKSWLNLFNLCLHIAALQCECFFWKKMYAQPMNGKLTDDVIELLVAQQPDCRERKKKKKNQLANGWWQFSQW